MMIATPNTCQGTFGALDHSLWPACARDCHHELVDDFVWFADDTEQVMCRRLAVVAMLDGVLSLTGN